MKIIDYQIIDFVSMNEDSDNSNMFKVDHSDQYTHEDNQNRINNLFHKDKQILHQGQKRVVVYGSLEQQPKTVYQIVQPYIVKAAQFTGQAAVVAGKGLYNALANGATWIYDKFVNNVVPYTTQQLPRLFFVIKNSINNDKKMYSSDSFHVLQIDQNDYDSIKKKQKKKTKKRVIVNLGPNDDPQFIKFLQKQKYVAETSFPIDSNQDSEEETFMVPSANFMVLHNQAMKKNMPKLASPQKNLQLQQNQTEQYSISHKISQQKQQQHNTQIQNSNIKSFIDEIAVKKQVQDYKRVQKKIFKLKDCYIFELEGKNSIQYDLLDGIERDTQTKHGFLVNSNKFNIGNINSQSEGQSGQAPLLIQKIVDNKINVRVQIPQSPLQINTNNIKTKVQQKQLQLA